jgi:lipopolysaccharide heptosyltransferase III
MLKLDCRFFSGDRPCSYHKEMGIKCDNCTFYSPIGFKILIIKLDAMGDVLRTTSILPPLKSKYNEAHISWCTRKDSEKFLKNSFVDEIILLGVNAESRIFTEKYDLVINLDTSKLSSSLASVANGVVKQGFILDEKGFVVPTSDEALEWLSMSAFDDVKAKNNKTYQEIIYNILDLGSEIARPVIQLKEEESTRKLLAEKFNIVENKPVIGLNTGVGSKWPSKGWPLKCWKELVELLIDQDYNLLILGGPDECKQNNMLADKYKSLKHTGCNNSTQEFSHIINLCDLIVTCDTFALHVATALKKKIVALFGPTSLNEIYLYNNGIKLKADSECACYYQQLCKESVSCMEKISPVSVVNSIKKLLQ